MEKLVFFLGTKKCFKLRNLPSRSSTLFPSRRSARPFLNCDQVSSRFTEYSGKLTFYTLCSRNVRYWKEIYVFTNVSQKFYIFLIEFSRKIGKCARSETDNFSVYFCHVLSGFWSYGFSNKNFHQTICLFIVFCLLIHNISWKHDRRI